MFKYREVIKTVCTTLAAGVSIGFLLISIGTFFFLIGT